MKTHADAKKMHKSFGLNAFRREQDQKEIYTFNSAAKPVQTARPDYTCDRKVGLNSSPSPSKEKL